MTKKFSEIKDKEGAYNLGWDEGRADIKKLLKEMKEELKKELSIFYKWDNVYADFNKQSLTKNEKIDLIELQGKLSSFEKEIDKIFKESAGV